MNIRNSKRLPLTAAIVIALGLASGSVYGSKAGTPPTEESRDVPSLNEAFAAQDINGDGVLSRDEYLAVNYEGRSFDDADSDGNGLLNEAEYVKARSLNERLTVEKFVDDAWITTKVKAVLIKEDVLTGLKIEVDTSGGVVQLSGWVENRKQASVAETIVSKVKGVRRVENDLLVKS